MKIQKSIIAIASLCASLCSYGQGECNIDVSIASITKGDVVPEAINSKLEGKLTQALGKAGMISAPYDSRFFVAGRFDDAFNDVTGGPSQKVYVKTTLTLYIGDADEQKIFASESFELNGVGGSDQQAYTRALNKLNAGNKQLLDFLRTGQQKIIDYFDANYQKYINDARKAMAARNYDEALYYATAIPSCCKGYAQANELAMQIYKQSMNHTAQQLLAKARGAWAANPNAEGAAEAHMYLSQIDPEASCAAEAQALSKQISQTTQKQWEFENVTKYKDAVALEKHRITAAKEVAVAWAQSRPKQVNRYVFITPGARY